MVFRNLLLGHAWSLKFICRSKLKLFGTIIFVVVLQKSIYGQQMNIKRVEKFDNINHPQIAYWLFSPPVYATDQYLTELDHMAIKSKFTLVFLTARQGADFYDVAKMKPIFAKLVARAHQRGLQIGLQLNENQSLPVALPNTERIITENETILGTNGTATIIATAKHVRHPDRIIQSELFKAYAFKKTADGFYQPGTFQDITTQCETTSSKPESVAINIHAGKLLQGYTVYIMAQHYYNYSSNHSPDAIQRFYNILNQYKDIPFDGIALDEFTNFRVTPDFELRRKNQDFRERSFSLSMADEFKQKYKLSLDKTLFDMRYAPDGKPEIRIRAINYYMTEMRSGPLKVETAVYKKAKELFGPNEFAGFHDTHHNQLDGDEIWQTGLNWWNLPREYGQTDEGSPTFVQLGIAKAYPQNAMYNMYYNKKLNVLTQKALSDLSYGVRTHYHGINDFEGWGVSINTDTALVAINKVENCTRLLNNFNPALAKTPLLIIFGAEALANWYPNIDQRSRFDINDKLFIEEKAKAVWNAGYRNVLVPTDLIESGKLKVNAAGQAEMSGHKFDAILFLYPQYSRPATLQFLEQYLQKGGKLMTEGKATYDFDGNDISARWKNISAHAVVSNFSVDKIIELGISPDTIKNRILNEDGSYIFTDMPSLFHNQTATCAFTHHDKNYIAYYRGLIAVSFNDTNSINKLAASGLTELSCDGKVLIKLSKPADLFAVKQGSTWQVNLLDPDQRVLPQIKLP